MRHICLWGRLRDNVHSLLVSWSMTCATRPWLPPRSSVPPVQRPICEFHGLCHDLSSMRLHAIQAGQTYTLQQFVEAHEQHRQVRNRVLPQYGQPSRQSTSWERFLGQQRGAVRAVKGGAPGVRRGSGTASAEGHSTSSQRRQITSWGRGGVVLCRQRITGLIDQGGR